MKKLAYKLFLAFLPLDLIALRGPQCSFVFHDGSQALGRSSYEVFLCVLLTGGDVGDEVKACTII
jgi:hypothetical protein